VNGEEDKARRDAAALAETVYNQLRAIAQRKLAQERTGHTLQATALVHEAYMRLGLADGGEARPDTRFYGAAAEAMRRILIEHARARKAAKRGGDRERVDWTEAIAGAADLANVIDPAEFEALDGAILRLQEHDPRAAEVVRLRFFAGLGIEEVARALDISPRSVKRDWQYARAWLLRELERTSKPGP